MEKDKKLAYAIIDALKDFEDYVQCEWEVTTNDQCVNAACDTLRKALKEYENG